MPIGVLMYLAAVTKYYTRTGWPKQQTLIFLQFWRLKVHHQVPANSVFGESSFLHFVLARPFLSEHA